MRYFSSRLMLFGSAIVLCGTVGAPAARAQCPIDALIHPNDAEGYGGAMNVLPDLDGDGVQEFVVGTEFELTPLGRGVFRIYSGATREILHEFHCKSDIGVLSDATVADVDGDGEWEFIGGVAGNDWDTKSGAVMVFEQGQLGPVTSVYAQGEMFYFGVWVLNIGDVNGDGAEEVLATGSTYSFIPNGGVRVMKGIDLETVWEEVPDDLGDKSQWIGRYVFAVGDINNDDVPDCAFTIFHYFEGRLELTYRSGADGEEILTVELAEFPNYRLLMIDDVNGDGYPEFVMQEGSSRLSDKLILSGADGSIMHAIEDVNASPLTTLPDLDGDGVQDLLLRSYADENTVVVVSTMTGETLLSREYLPDLESELTGAAAIGDLDSDGRTEVLLQHFEGLTIFQGVIEIQPIEYAGCLAELNAVDVRLGTLLSGNLGSLQSPDDDTFDLRSAIGFSALEPDVAEVEVLASAHESPQDFVSLQIDLALTQPNGQLAIRARNWQTKAFDLITTAPVGMDEVRIGVSDLAGASYVRADDGAITLRLRTVVPASFSALGFETAFDWVDVITR